MKKPAQSHILRHKAKKIKNLFLKVKNVHKVKILHQTKIKFKKDIEKGKRHMTNSISRRTVVRIVSFVLAAMSVMAGIAIYQYTQAQRYYATIEYSYQRALSDLNDSLASISTELEKGVYSATAQQMSHLSANLWKNASVAKTSLSSLPVTDLNMSATYKFLSQVGEYAMSLSKKMASGQELTAEEQELLVKLRDYSEGLSESMATITQDMYNSQMDIHEIANLAKTLDNQNSDDIPWVISGFQKMEDSFEGYPTLIYDGPFSDHIMQKESQLLKTMDKVDRNTAAQTAAKLLGCDVDKLKDESDENSNIPSYSFEYDGGVISITQNGGMVSYILRSREITEAKVKAEEAVKAAQKYLNDLGFTSMKESYYETSNGICIVNFAYEQDGVIVYPDLIKVSVALDNCDILSMDARGYIMSHSTRDVGTKISQEEASKSVSNLLTIESCYKAIIPTDGENEVLCYEFRTKGSNDEDVFVYVNAQTGAEEEILMILKGEDGILVK